MFRPPHRHDDSSMAARSLACAAVLAVLVSGCASDADTVVGHYVEHIEARDNPPWRALIGDFAFDFDEHGTLTVGQIGGAQLVHARYRFDGDLLTIDESGGVSSCRESGLDLASAQYRVRHVSGGIALQVVRDECRGRREAIPLRPLRRVD